MNGTEPTIEPMNASLKKNELWAEVESLPDLIRQELRPIDAKVRRLLNHNEGLSIKEVYLMEQETRRFLVVTYF